MPDVVVESPALFEVATGPGQAIGRRLTLFDSEGRRAVFLGATAIHVYDGSDKEAEAVCIVTLSRAGLASDVDIAAGFGIHRNTVGRLVSRFERDGMAAVVPAKRGPKGPSKVTPEVMEIIAANADLPRRELRDLLRESTGVSLSLPYVHELASAYRARQLELDGVGAAAGAESSAGADHGEAAEPVDGGDDGDVVGDRDADVDLAGRGQISGDGRNAVDGGLAFDPPPTLPHGVDGYYMGLALYYPALAAVGLVETARSLFGLARSQRFGVRAVTVTLFFMTILSRTTLEAAKHLRRAEFGAVVGSGRAPCVKTLRRKLAELVAQNQAGELGVRLARRWVDTGVVASA